MKNYNIAVAGTGYVGLSLGVLLSQHHQVVAVDIVQAKVDMINNKKSPIQFIQVLLEANGLAAGKDHQFKGRYDAEKNAVIISLEKDEQSALSPQKCTT